MNLATNYPLLLGLVRPPRVKKKRRQLPKEERAEVVPFDEKILQIAEVLRYGEQSQQQIIKATGFCASGTKRALDKMLERGLIKTWLVPTRMHKRRMVCLAIQEYDNRADEIVSVLGDAEMTTAEVAALTGVNRRTVYFRLARLRDKHGIVRSRPVLVNGIETCLWSAT